MYPTVRSTYTELRHLLSRPFCVGVSGEGGERTKLIFLFLFARKCRKIGVYRFGGVWVAGVFEWPALLYNWPYYTCTKANFQIASYIWETGAPAQIQLYVLTIIHTPGFDISGRRHKFQSHKKRREGKKKNSSLFQTNILLSNYDIYKCPQSPPPVPTFPQLLHQIQNVSLCTDTIVR